MMLINWSQDLEFIANLAAFAMTSKKDVMYFILWSSSSFTIFKGAGLLVTGWAGNVLPGFFGSACTGAVAECTDIRLSADFARCASILTTNCSLYSVSTLLNLVNSRRKMSLKMQFSVHDWSKVLRWGVYRVNRMNWQTPCRKYFSLIHRNSPCRCYCNSSESKTNIWLLTCSEPILDCFIWCSVSAIIFYSCLVVILLSPPARERDSSIYLTFSSRITNRVRYFATMSSVKFLTRLSRSPSTPSSQAESTFTLFISVSLSSLKSVSGSSIALLIHLQTNSRYCLFLLSLSVATGWTSFGALGSAGGLAAAIIALSYATGLLTLTPSQNSTRLCSYSLD